MRIIKVLISLLVTLSLLLSISFNSGNALFIKFGAEDVSAASLYNYEKWTVYGYWQIDNSYLTEPNLSDAEQFIKIESTTWSAWGTSVYYNSEDSTFRIIGNTPGEFWCEGSNNVIVNKYYYWSSESTSTSDRVYRRYVSSIKDCYRDGEPLCWPMYEVWGYSAGYVTKSYIESKNSYISTIQATDGTYPDNGKHSDGYWYVKKDPVNITPTISLNLPSPNDTFSTVQNQMTVSGTVKDTDAGDILTVKYRIDGSSGEAGTQLGSAITANGADQAYSGNINVGALTNGSHFLYQWVEDNKGGKSSEYSIPFTMDKTAPTTPTLTADKTALTNTNVTVTISNWGDAATKQYRVAGGSWTSYTAPVVIASNCLVEARGIDAVGNVSGVGSYTVSNIDKTAPTTPSLTADKTAPTNTNVTVTISNWGDAATKQYRIDGGSWTAYTAPVIVALNCTVEARGIDAVGNVSGTGSYTVSNIDKTASTTPSLTADKTTPTNTNVTVTISNWGDAATKQYRVAGGSWTGYTAPVVITSNCLVEARGIDAVGNISGVGNYTVSNIDKIPPTTPALAADITVPTNQDVTVTISNWGDAATKQYRIDGGSWTAYTAPVVVSSNCTVEARGIDAVGNISGTGNYTVSNIDKVPPTTPTLEADITAPTNTDVTVTISNWGDAATKQYRVDGGSWTGYTAPVVVASNCTVEARGIDAVGNVSGTGSYTVSNIDKVSPTTPTLAADITDPTNHDVTVTVSNWGDAATKQYRIDGGAWTAYTAPVVVASNCTVEARGIDAVGNISGVGSYTVSNIDKVPPTTPTLAADITAPTNQDVTVTISNWGDAATKQYRVDGGSWTVYTVPVVVSENCTLEARGIDAVGNISGVGSYTVSNIDKVPPTTPTIAADITAPTNQDVTVTISNWGDAATKQYRIDGGSWTVYTAPVVVASNCTVEARGIDAVGNISGTGSYTVSNIDKVPPTTPALAADITVPTNQDVTVTISNWGDAATKQYRIDGGAWNNYTTPAAISFNCLIEARGTDSVGNISGIGSLNISNIDKTAPSTPTLTADKTAPTNQDVTVTISNWGDATTKQYRIDNGAWTTYTTPAAVSFNCTIEARGIDAVGNISITANFKVENIFKSPVVTQDADHDYHLSLTGDLKSGWQYEIIIKDDSDNAEIFNQRYLNITTDVEVLKSYLSSGYSFLVTENILDSDGNVIFSNYSDITKEIDRLEFVSPDLFLYNGQTHQYNIKAYFIDGSVKDNFLEVDWTSSNPDIQVNNMGQVSVNNAGTAIITATVRTPNDSISIYITVSCEALSDFDITSNAKSYIIEGDVIQYNVRALLNPTVINNYTNLTWSVDDSTIAVIDQSGKLQTKLDGTVIVTATDKTLPSFSESFPVIIHAAPTVLENSDNAFVINLAGDLNTGWEYGVKVTNVTTSAVIYEQNQPSDALTVTIPKSNLIEGNSYSIDINILNGSIVNSRTLSIKKADTLYPQITRVYIDQGKLYVLAEDNVGLNLLPYRYTILSTANVQNVQDIINSHDPFQMQLLIEADRDLNNLCTSWISENNINNVKIQDKFKIEVRDSSNNINTIEVIVNKTAGTLYGQKTPEEIAAEEPDQSTPEVTTSTQIKKEADTALSEVVAISDEAPLNSQTGQITVDLSSIVSSMQSSESLLKDCRYRLELYKKFTGEIIYSKILIDTSKIVIPDLDDATVYLVKVVIINSDGVEITSKSFEAETADRTPPIITSIKTSEGNFTVAAQDNKSLAQEAYKFEIVSTGILSASGITDNDQVASMISRTKMILTASNWNLNTWTSSNTMEGVQTNMIIKTVVRDSTGNTAEMITTVSSMDEELVNLINADNPLILIPGTTGNLSNYFGMEGDITYTINDPGTATIDQNGNITALKNGQVIVTARDNKTGTIKQLLIKLKHLNTTNVRRIIVEKDSITNLKYLYSDYLLNIFGTTEGLAWMSREAAVSEISNAGVLKALNYGITKVTAIKDGKTFNTYVVVVKPGTVKSDIQEIFVKAPYLIKKGDILNLDIVSEFIDFTDKSIVKGAFVIYESSDYSVVEISGDKLIATGEGLAEVIAFDLINNIIEKVKVRVEDMSPEPLQYKDIDTHWAKGDIEAGTNLGITKGYEDGNFNPDNMVTNNEFLIMFSRTMLASDDSSGLIRTESYKGLNPGAQYYNNYAYALNNISALFAYDVFGSFMAEDKIITRGEVAEIILSHTKGKLVTEPKEYNIKDIEGQPHESALRYCLESGVFIGCGDGTVQGDRGLTRAEMIVIMNRLYELNK